MKVKEVINLALKLLDISDLDLDSENITSDERYNKFMSAVSMIQSQLATDYFNLKKIMPINAATDNKSVSYSDFDFRPLNIIKVVDSNGKKGRYEETDSGIIINYKGNYNIHYNYLPSAPNGLTDDIVCDKAISDRVFALGVASLYAAMNGLFEEAVNFDEKYLISLKISAKKPKNSYIKEIKWI